MNKYQTEEFPDGKGHQRHGSATFYSLLEEMAATHDRKSHDYATSDKPFINYEFAGTIANLFSHSAIDAGFAGRLAEKIMRLSVLEAQRLQPKNESIADTERDIAVIATLWMAARKDKQNSEQIAMPGALYTVPASQPVERYRDAPEYDETLKSNQHVPHNQRTMDEVVKKSLNLTRVETIQLIHYLTDRI